MPQRLSECAGGTSGFMHWFESSEEKYPHCLSPARKVFVDSETETAVPLLTNTASVPRRPSHAGAGLLDNP